MCIRINQLLLYIFFLTGVSEFSFAQPQNDFRTVLGLSIEKKISRSFSLSFLNNEIINQNVSELGLGFIDLGINYRLNRNFTFGANYRFVKSRNLDNFYDDRQMIYGDISFLKYFNNISVTVRSRFQNQYYPHLFSDNYRPLQIYNRNRIALRYKINYYASPFLSVENFLYLNRSNGRRLTNMRYTAGLNYTFNEKVKTEFFYSYDNGMNRVNRVDYFSIGTTCYFKF